MVEFMYFNEEWNGEKVKTSRIDETGVAGSSEDADTGEK